MVVLNRWERRRGQFVLMGFQGTKESFEVTLFNFGFTFPPKKSIFGYYGLILRPMGWMIVHG